MGVCAEDTVEDTVHSQTSLPTATDVYPMHRALDHVNDVDSKDDDEEVIATGDDVEQEKEEKIVEKADVEEEGWDGRWVKCLWL